MDYPSLMYSNRVHGLREVVDALVADALVADPLEDRSVTELQALIAGISAQIERLAGLSSLALGELAAISGGTVPPAATPPAAAPPDGSDASAAPAKPLGTDLPLGP